MDAALARFWALIRAELAARGIASPVLLDQDRAEFAVWTDPALVLSQTCGMPFRLWLHDRVGLVGTPDYGLAGCPPGYYRSAIVVRRDDGRAGLAAFSDATFAYNQRFSQSGYAAPWAHLRAQGFRFRDLVQTGGHLASARAVAEGRADIAALDAVTWRLIGPEDGLEDRLRVIDWTAPSPGLPLITGPGLDAQAIAAGVAAAIATLSAEDRAVLGLRGLVAIPKAAYLAVPNPPGSDKLVLPS